MLPEQTAYTTPRQEIRPEMSPRPVEQRPVIPEYNEQFIETLAQRLMPKLMPEIMHQMRLVQPATIRTRYLGMSLALAIVSLALMVPLLGILIGPGMTGLGIGGVLIGIGLVCVTMVLVNVAFNYMLFNTRM